MIKGVIFDIDGVLLDSMHLWWDLGARYLRSLGIEPEEGICEKLHARSMEEGAAYLTAHYDLKKSEAEVMQDVMGVIEKFYFEEVEEKKGARETMQYYRNLGIPMVAATSSPREHVTRALMRVGLLEYLDAIYTTSEMETSKHEPKIYLHAAEELGCRPDEVFVYEDSLYALRTAKEAGFHTVGIYDAASEADQGALRELAEVYIR